MPINKKTAFTLMASLLSLTAYSQIKNPDFDQQQGDSLNSIAPWKVKPTEGFQFELDKSIKHSGTASLKLTAKENKGGAFMPFSQLVEINVTQLKKIAVTAFIKCTDVNKEVSLWCQILDSNGKMIGFQNLGVQGVQISGTSEWRKYTMPITLNPTAKKLLLGGFLSGTGTAWFDDFEIEEISQNATPAAEVVKTYINEFIHIVKQNSVFTDSLNWPLIEKDVATLSAGLNAVAEAKAVLDYVIQELKAAGDNHSFIQNKVSAQQYATANSNPEKPEVKLRAGNIGYVSVPGFSSTSPAVSVQFATDIQNMIRKLDGENQIAGWIVDLRNNTGGNMYPMIAGLGPLTGEGSLGYFVKMVNKKETQSAWFYKKGSSGAGSGSSVSVAKPYVLKRRDAKIAVIIGTKTGSSGEMTAISFIGKENTKLFGTSSAGYTTGNAIYKLSDGSNLVLASSYTADRNMKRYMKKISPDVVVNQGNDGADADLKAAETWLLM